MRTLPNAWRETFSQDSITSIDAVRFYLDDETPQEGINRFTFIQADRVLPGFAYPATLISATPRTQRVDPVTRLATSGEWTLTFACHDHMRRFFIAHRVLNRRVEIFWGAPDLSLDNATFLLLGTGVVIKKPVDNGLTITLTLKGLTSLLRDQQTSIPLFFNRHPIDLAKDLLAEGFVGTPYDATSFDPSAVINDSVRHYNLSSAVPGTNPKAPAIAPWLTGYASRLELIHELCQICMASLFESPDGKIELRRYDPTKAAIRTLSRADIVRISPTDRQVINDVLIVNGSTTGVGSGSGAAAYQGVAELRVKNDDSIAHNTGWMGAPYERSLKLPNRWFGRAVFADWLPEELLEDYDVDLYMAPWAGIAGHQYQPIDGRTPTATWTRPAWADPDETHLVYFKAINPSRYFSGVAANDEIMSFKTVWLQSWRQDGHLYYSAPEASRARIKERGIDGTPIVDFDTQYGASTESGSPSPSAYPAPAAILIDVSWAYPLAKAIANRFGEGPFEFDVWLKPIHADLEACDVVALADIPVLDFEIANPSNLLFEVTHAERDGNLWRIHLVQKPSLESTTTAVAMPSLIQSTPAGEATPLDYNAPYSVPVETPDQHLITLESDIIVNNDHKELFHT